MKYFRSYPLFLQLLLFAAMVLPMSGFGSLMIYLLLPKFTSFTLLQIVGITEQSPIALINTAILVQGILSIFSFLIPAWLFSYLAHPQPAEYIGLRLPGRKIQWVLVILVMLGAIPVLELIESLISQINFGAKIKASQAANDHMTAAFLTMPTFYSFLRAFVVMAIIPAFGEELFFRGVLLRFAKKKARTMEFPIFLTAFVFAFFHSNIYGFLSIFLAGVLLAVIYYLTGSLWCSILAHLFFNGSQVILAYLGNYNAGFKTYIENSTLPIYIIIAGAIIFGISFYLLLKNKTPLPGNWTDDFPPGNDGDIMAKI
jgi:membrane protease YdiL (CAAX protease family)